MGLLAIATGLLGGVGLFLLGMRLMTDGLKVAAGDSLRRILRTATRTPAHGLLAGVLITALAQSSSAVTVATIGFVNAGVLDLARAITVVLGSNVGTTMTGWIVAGLGLKLELTSLAIPLVGIGAFVHLASRGRRAALGDALSGFGLFFVGIGVLGQTFASLGDSVDLAGLARPGLAGVLLFVVIGFGLTALVQSSSAALTLVLSAAAGGVVPFDAAAATVIGTNLGTTSTALLAVIGATPNARRVAAAHVVFNLLAAFAALVLLPVLLLVVDWLMRGLALESTPVTALALFHTSFNLLGVAILWPLRGRLVDVLAARFRSREEDESTPRFLDQNVVGTPDLALAALARELGHTGDLARRMACSALTRGPEAQSEIALQRVALDGLHAEVSRFTAQVGRGELPEELLAATALALRAASDQAELAERAGALAALRGQPLPAGGVREAIDRFESEVLARVEDTSRLRSEVPGREEDGGGAQEPATADVGLLGAYETAKDALLRAVTRAELPAERWSVQLDRLRVARGIGEYAIKGRRRLEELEAILGLPASPPDRLPGPPVPSPPARRPASDAFRPESSRRRRGAPRER